MQVGDDVHVLSHQGDDLGYGVAVSVEDDDIEIALESGEEIWTSDGYTAHLLNDDCLDE